MMTLQVPAKDGYSLAVNSWEGDPRRPVVIINAATGVKQSFYQPFAEFLASEGLGVVTYDYRGIGLSKPQSGLKGFPAALIDWARKDAQAIFDWVASRSSGREISVVGHSFGGQLLGLLEGNERLQRVMMVGAQSGYWRNFPLKSRTYLLPLWYVAMPMAVTLQGFFPSARLGLGEDLPGGVALEWAKWCKSPEYYYGEFASGLPNRFFEIQGPIRVYQITDDSHAPEKSIKGLIKYLPDAHVQIRKIEPSEIKKGSIGHFGFFRSKLKDPLWYEAVEFLRS